MTYTHAYKYSELKFIYQYLLFDENHFITLPLSTVLVKSLFMLDNAKIENRSCMLLIFHTPHSKLVAPLIGIV